MQPAVINPMRVFTQRFEQAALVARPQFYASILRAGYDHIAAAPRAALHWFAVTAERELHLASDHIP